MNAVETVQAVLTAIEARDWEGARGSLADDFTFGGVVPDVIGPDAWLGIHRALAVAMPDFSFNARDFREEGGRVLAEVHLTGTQTRVLALPVPDLAPVAPTGKRVSLPAEHLAVTMRGDKLASIITSEVVGGGLPGLLAQLGATIPTHA